MNDTRVQLQELIASQLQTGFTPIHEIIENAMSLAEERGNDKSLPLVRQLVAEAHSSLQGDQQDWPSITDCDRLDQAFEQLNAQGIVARQNFSCCNNCGFTEIWDEVDKEEMSQVVTGYVFYHLQCTERAIKTGQLLIAYGCLAEDERELKRIVSKIVEELKSVGLSASWQGTAGHPILVDGIKWQKRR